MADDSHEMQSLILISMAEIITPLYLVSVNFLLLPYLNYFANTKC